MRRKRTENEGDDKRWPDARQMEVPRVVLVGGVVVWLEWSFDSFRQRKYIPADWASRFDFSVGSGYLTR